MEILSIKENYENDKVVNMELEMKLTEEENRVLLGYAITDILKKYIKEEEEKREWLYTP